ncbi:MAG: phytanoyl-CoA dioxygenase family protein [Candidatus Puniceispirillales bacterium WSBS_2018_MAG_OTU23]
MAREISADDIKLASDALLDGVGYYMFEEVFDADEVASANGIINEFSKDAGGATHFHGAHADKINLQRRVWNLLNKGQIFIDMVQNAAVMEIFGKILGRKFILGSFAANRLLPGAPGQEPHIDYPYWDMHDTAEFPHGMNAGFHMNCQSLIALHDFTVENGATAVAPHSQKRGVYPTEATFKDEHIQLPCPAGSLLVFTGLTWHCAMPNNSDADRTSVLGQYLPKFVKPMEDLKQSVAADVAANASPELRQLLGLDLRYPELLEDAQTGNAEGRS